jgi:hypothetical protein
MAKQGRPAKASEIVFDQDLNPNPELCQIQTESRLETLERIVACISPRSLEQAHTEHKNMLQVNKLRLELKQKYFGDYGQKPRENPSMNRYAAMSAEELEEHRIAEGKKVIAAKAAKKP